jgi:DNA-binding response OmpR family regulator
MQSVAPKNATSDARTPIVLVIDDEPEMLEAFKDTIVPGVRARVQFARSMAEAKKVMSKQPIGLMVADVHLPDGSGMDLLETLRLTSPDAGAIFMTQKPTVDQTIFALRHGALDYLPKPFTAKKMTDHVNSALQRQEILVRNEKRLTRLKTAVRELNKSRRTVSKKVDLLCNDLVTAYTELAAQMQDVRLADGFRKTIETAKDLEQLLCHAMDWLLKEAGYSNIAIWLSGDEGGFELGAYMKYTIVGEKKVTKALHSSLIDATVREGFLHLSDAEFAQMLQPAERKLLPGQTVMSANCTYLGEALAVLTLFRDGKCPFREEDAAMLKTVSAVFATALATMVRTHDDEEEAGEAPDGTDLFDGPPSDQTWSDEQPKKKKPKETKGDADWWKRGEEPPF